MAVVIGWDIGGAHLKAARAENDRIVEVVQIASPLRLGLSRLTQSFAEAQARIGPADRHAVTMTGELADTFETHADGVRSLAAAAQRELSPANVMIYAGRAGFIAPAHVDRHIADIASANWFASAALVGRAVGTALFMDMGSTTTDIVPVIDGAAGGRGYTDAERLGCGELIYTGLVRSFLMGLTPRVPFDGCWSEPIKENFATMADVHRILGRLPEGADQMNTADGRDKTIAASRARLARMVGRDAADAGDAEWQKLALWFAEAQIRSILDGAMLVLSRGHLPAEAPVVVAGVGSIVLREVAWRLGRDGVDFNTIVDAEPKLGATVSYCAPAVALALLASKVPERSEKIQLVRN